VTKLNDKGFILSDDLVVPGGVVFLGGRAMLWDVDPPLDPAKTGSKGLEGSWEGWEVERFKVFEVVVPRPGMF
jgi:NADH dehydrogenase [ubiquinone] 1 alpha subcomplex assembly factor 3